MKTRAALQAVQQTHGVMLATLLVMRGLHWQGRCCSGKLEACSSVSTVEAGFPIRACVCHSRSCHLTRVYKAHRKSGRNLPVLTISPMPSRFGFNDSPQVVYHYGGEPIDFKDYLDLFDDVLTSEFPPQSSHETIRRLYFLRDVLEILFYSTTEYTASP